MPRLTSLLAVNAGSKVEVAVVAVIVQVVQNCTVLFCTVLFCTVHWCQGHCTVFTVLRVPWLLLASWEPAEVVSESS